MHRAALLALVASLLVPAAALAQPQAACIVGNSPGLDPADVETTASIVCGQLRKQGARVGEPTWEQTGPGYRVHLRPLGRKVFLALQAVDEAGVVQRESELLLQEIEEVPVAAPRLVEALLGEKPVEQTASVDSLVGEETRPYRKKGGETFFGIGFLGMGVPGTDMVPGGGFLLRGAFETEDFGVISDLRIAGGSPELDDAFFFSLGVGARWFLADGNWSPFLGGGLAWTALTVEEVGEFHGSQTGPGGWVEVGVETLRFYESRLTLDLRAELPFYELDEDGWRGDDQAYYLPVTVGFTYMW